MKYEGIAIVKPKDSLSEILNEYSVGFKVPRYISKTREQVLAVARVVKADALKTPEEARDFYEKSVIKCKNDDELVKWYIELCGFELYNARGDVYSTDNPYGKYSWYGAESINFDEKDPIQAEAVVIPDGSIYNWVDLDSFGKKDSIYSYKCNNWEDFVKKAVHDNPSCLIYKVSFHS